MGERNLPRATSSLEMPMMVVAEVASEGIPVLRGVWDPRACRIEKRANLAFGKLAGSQKESSNLGVAIRIHGNSLPPSSRRNQARTMVHSRSTDRLDIPITLATSAMPRPPKNRSSIIWAWHGSSFVSLVKASSSANRSTSRLDSMTRLSSAMRCHVPPRLAALCPEHDRRGSVASRERQWPRNGFVPANQRMVDRRASSRLREPARSAEEYGRNESVAAISASVRLFLTIFSSPFLPCSHVPIDGALTGKADAQIGCLRHVAVFEVKPRFP